MFAQSWQQLNGEKGREHVRPLLATVLRGKCGRMFTYGLLLATVLNERKGRENVCPPLAQFNEEGGRGNVRSRSSASIGQHDTFI